MLRPCEMSGCRGGCLDRPGDCKVALGAKPGCWGVPDTECACEQCELRVGVWSGLVTVWLGTYPLTGYIP